MGRGIIKYDDTGFAKKDFFGKINNMGCEVFLWTMLITAAYGIAMIITAGSAIGPVINFMGNGRATLGLIGALALLIYYIFYSFKGGNEKGKDEELAEQFRNFSNSTTMGGIPNEVRREMIKSELDYRNAKKTIVLSKGLFWLTIVLYTLIGILIILP